MNSKENNLLPSEPPQPSDPVPQSVETLPPSAFPAEEPAAPTAPEGPPIPEDLRTPWGWIDLLTFVLVALCGAFLVSVILAAIFAGLGTSLAQLRSSASEQSFFAVVNQGVLSLGLLAYLAVQVRLRAGTPFWRTIGWRPLKIRRMPGGLAYLAFVAGGLLLSAAVQFASGIAHPKGKLPIEMFFQDRRSAILLMLLSVLLAPVFEETVFRGYIYPVIARRFGVTASVVATGILFGALHAPQLWGGWVQIALLVLVGIVFTYARAATRTVVSSFLLHVSYNSFLLAAFLVSTQWLRVLPPGH